jgi:hypothetical protein
VSSPPQKRPPTIGDRGEIRRSTPARGIETLPDRQPSWDEDTAVGTDVQVFHAVRDIGRELTAHKRAAAAAHGALAERLSGVEAKVDGLDSKLDVVAIGNANLSGKMDVLLSSRRDRSVSSETRTVVTETLATEVLKDARERKQDERAAKQFRRKLLLKIVGGAITAGGGGALVHWLATR